MALDAVQRTFITLGIISSLLIIIILIWSYKVNSKGSFEFDVLNRVGMAKVVRASDPIVGRWAFSSNGNYAFDVDTDRMLKSPSSLFGDKFILAKGNGIYTAKLEQGQPPYTMTLMGNNLTIEGMPSGQNSFVKMSPDNPPSPPPSATPMALTTQ